MVVKVASRIRMNKRQHGRYITEHPATLILQDGIKIDCRIQNFSLSGLFILPLNSSEALETISRVPRDDIVAIQVITPRDSKGSSIIVQAMIAHIAEPGLGMAFLNQENELLDYLHRLTSSEADHHYKEQLKGNSTPGMGAKEISIAKWIHSSTGKYLEARYPQFIKIAYNTLFDAANNAPDNQSQRELFDAYNTLKTNEDEIAGLFLDNIRTCFNKLTSGENSPEDPSDPGTRQQNMELVAKEDFEEWVSVVSLTKNLNHEVSSKLYKLESALSSLTKTYISNESNPVSPYSLLWSYNRSVLDLTIALDAKKLLFSVFRENVLRDISTLYDEINQYLSNHGITHKVHSEATRRSQTKATGSNIKSKLTDTLSSLMNLIGNKRAGDYQESAGAAPREMVMRSLEDISATSHRPIIQSIEEQLSGEQVDGQPVVVDSRTRDAIQVSENLLGSLQQEFVVNPQIQHLIDSLKIPFVKETINDPNLLNDPSHPGHKLLETIGKLTPFLPAADDGRSDKGYLFQTLEEIRRLTESGTDLDIRDITVHLEHLVDHQKNDFQNNQDMVTQSCEQDEQYLNTRDMVFELLCTKLVGKTIPKTVEELLQLGWVGLLVQTISTLGQEHEDSQSISGAIDLLLETFDTHHDVTRTDQPQTDHLITVIADGFSRYPTHVLGSNEYIAKLTEFLNSGGKQHPDLATEQVELNRAQIRQLLEEQTTSSTQTIPETEVEKSWLDLVSGIQLDDWIVEQREQGHARMLNLAWTNPAATRYVFVDGEGKKGLDTENHNLAIMFKQQQCSLLEDGKLPIVEQAVNRLLKNTFEQIKNDSNTDELTHLLGRKAFQREISELLEVTNDVGDQHVMLELDIDQFNMINDMCGFKGGDKLLQTFANIISNYLPDNTILARIGDDEFGVLLKNHTLDKAYHVAETQRRALENLRYTWDGTTIPATTSVGVVSIDSNITTAIEVLDKASSACRLAIQDGGNCTRTYQPTDNDIEKRKKLLQAVPIIEDTLEKNKLSLFAQPITPLFMYEEEEHHYEILLRIKNNGGSWESPIEFIQAAEKYNRMRSVDRWVINQVFSWLENHYTEVNGVGFSINLSAQSLDDNTLPGFISNHLERSPFPNNQLTLEITETSLVKNIDKTKMLVDDIKSKGVKFSLDDFGTGYSSYSYLKDFPVDYVKIDGVFIKDMLTDTSSYAMVKSITEISHHMGKKVVAEYVESEAVLVALRELEVDFAQGFRVGHPTPMRNLLQERL